MQHIIKTESLTKKYGSTLALAGLDLGVRAGEVYGYLGPNGSGKTTTIRLLLGLHRPTSGFVSVFGLNAWKDPVSIHRRVAYVAGEPTLWPSLTGMETLDFLAHLHGGVDHGYRHDLIERFQLDPGKRVRDYSKGNRQKIQLIAAFATRADLLILDEPTSGLDPLMEVAFRETVREAKNRDQTIFLSSHILSEAEMLCDRVGILRAGKLVEEGTLDQLRHLASHTVDVTFTRPVPDFPALDGVSVVHNVGNSMQLQVTGAMDSLVKALAVYQVASMSSREPTLEDIFLTQYGSIDTGDPVHE